MELLHPTDLLPEFTADMAYDTVYGVLELGRLHDKTDYEKGKYTVEECLTHANQHIVKALAGDTSEPHLTHALTRLAMALYIREHNAK